MLLQLVDRFTIMKNNKSLFTLFPLFRNAPL